MMNAYDGEMKVTLYNKTYPMRINMGVIAKFQSETGKCFNNVAVNAVFAWNKSSGSADIFERASYLTDVISMVDAATLFYIAAKEMDSQVTFEEIQEAVLLDGVIPRKVAKSETRSYPVSFVDVVLFAMIGIHDKKKETK